MSGVREFGMPQIFSGQPKRRFTTSGWRSDLCQTPAGDGCLRQFFRLELDRHWRSSQSSTRNR